MPEGDTLYRIAAGLRPFLVGRPVIAATARPPGPRAELVVGATIEAVESRGKHLLIRFDRGLELRTHLGMHGSWHRYSPGERWLRSASRARLVLEVPGTVAVCFDAPAVELYEVRVESVHPVLAALGPDLLAPDFDETALAEAVHRLRDPKRARLTIAEALLDQRALAGVGNIWKNEALFAERIHPFARVGEIGYEPLRRLVVCSRRLLLASSEGGARAATDRGPSERRVTVRPWVYGRAGRACRRCGSIILHRRHGRLNRRTFWCPSCQAAVAEEPR